MIDPSAPPEHDERRRHTRFIPREVNISLVKEPGGLLGKLGMKGTNLAAQVLDLSEGGLRVVIKKRVPVGTRVIVDFRVDVLQDRLEIGGYILWLALHPSLPDLFIIGVRFTKMTPEQGKMIAHWRAFFNSPQAKQRESTRVRRKDAPGSGPQKP